MNQKTKIPPITISTSVYQKFSAINKKKSVKNAEIIRRFVEWYTEQKSPSPNIDLILEKYSFAGEKGSFDSTKIDNLLYR